MNETVVAATKGKKPANQTQAHMATINQVRAQACDAYIKAIRSVKDTPDWPTPSSAERINRLEVRTENGQVSAMIDGEMVSGYELITWVVTGSAKRGIHHVMIGALVMAGVHDLKVFTELDRFNPNDPDNVGFKTMKIVDLACTYYPSNFDQESLGSAPQSDSVLQVSDATNVDSTIRSGDPADEQHFHTDAQEEVAEPAGGVDNDNQACIAVENEDAPGVTGAEVSGGSIESQHLNERGPGEDNKDSIACRSSNLDNADINAQEPESCEDGNDDQFEEAELPAILKAFNEKVPSEAECLRQFHRHSQSQFCTEIRVGRLLLQKKQELKSSALFKKWKGNTFPEGTFDKHVLSRCTRYGQFEKSLKSRRGLLLEDRDIKLCSQKAMLLIGGYCKKNAEELIDDVVSLLDSGKALTEDAARELVQACKHKLEKQIPGDDEPPASEPRTIQELIDLPKKYLKPHARKQLTEYYELLDAVEQQTSIMSDQRAMVLPLVKMFTQFQ